MKVLLLGASGQLGWQLQRSLSLVADCHFLTRAQLDLANSQAIQSLLKQLQPDWVVNAAAYTAVDKAESEPALATQINALAPAVMAETLAKNGGRLLHFSTDYVFNGQGATPWRETDPTAPLNQYGASKLAGEQAITASQCQHLILRTGWVYGENGQNFFNTMRQLAKTRSTLSVVDDQIGAPTWSRHLADTAAQMLRHFQQSGIYHVSASGQTSWYQFAKAIFEALSQQGHNIPLLEAVTSNDYPAIAQRPAYSVLSNQKLKEHYDLCLPDWRQSLQWVLQSVALP
ncbi:dTDP-4-dehydrorhamnose reductase [Methylophaga frappieri]|uniref:dTDP-4-dehydrorhamnose reductase n=1 Tax=Methylophaga frappieri (strain ATCC BAA-2434 / DSM 25690 / JAM7) TaxID=754477 RepID=I1YG74_METFJ|nr:dTDP-4-dehydrorhamnose reductase [Methylophaga frappieri]AFJ01917.1 dTDP-4-dehydrorhamnose reductase [Methylophaga frappieri]